MINFVEEMNSRGLIAQIVHEEELVEHLQVPRTAYVGFDPTAASLHVGHLLPIMMLARWQRCGHRAIAVMGGGTALIGDPSGKTSMRQMLTEEQIEANIASFKIQVAGLLDLSEPSKGLIVNNADWLRPLNYLDFLREIGSQFSVNRMLTAECFKARLETGLSFLEFNYMLLQSYDFLHLYKNQDCTVQLGGDDQWSNILAGMDLVRRLTKGKAFCLTNPLLTTSDGKKMGKTEKGAVWLDPNLTSPYEYFQYWRNIPDDMVGKCLRYFTFLPMAQVKELESNVGAAINAAKVELAFECTKIVHGEEEAIKAKSAAAKLFSGSVESLAVGNEPVTEINRSEYAQGINICDLMVKVGAAASKSEARRLVAQGGVSIDGDKWSDPSKDVPMEVLAISTGALLRKGKKHYFRIKVTG